MTDYKHKLYAMIASTITHQTHGEQAPVVINQLESAITRINDEVLEYLKDKHEESGVTVTPKTILTQVQREIGYE